MKHLKLILILLIIFVLSIGYFLRKGYLNSKTFQKKRTEILSGLDNVLEEATAKGEYKCCIKPPCKMCFLGNWIFEGGKCDCDTLIAQNKMDKVCPECIHGIEEGRCESLRGTCPTESTGE